MIDRLDVRAPGTTHISLSGQAPAATSGRFKGALSIESTDPDALMMWLQGRSEPAYRSQNPFRLNGEVNISASSVAIDNVKCEIDGGAVEGRIALVHDASTGATLDAMLRADRLDIDSASAFVRAVLGPQSEWPERMLFSLAINHAISAGRDLHPFAAKFGYEPKTLTLESLKIGEATSVMLEGNGVFDRTTATGKLSLNSSAVSLSLIAGAITPVWPQLAARLDAMKLGPGPARLKLLLAIDKEAGRTDRAGAQALNTQALKTQVLKTQVSIDLDAPQFKGSVTLAARPGAETLRNADLDKLMHGEVTVDTKLSSEQGASLVALLGLDGMIAARDGPGQLQGSMSGVWGAPLHLKLDLTGAGFEVEAQGTADPFKAMDPKAVQANLSLKAHGLNLAPLFDLKPSDKLVQDMALTSRLALANGKVTFDDIDGAMAGSRLRGRVAMTLEGERRIDGEIGLDLLDLGPALALAIGAAGRDASEPFGSGLLKNWRGQIAFQALKGLLPGGSELRPVSGILKGDGQSLSIDGIKGGIGGGEASGNIEARQTAGGLSLNARVALSGVDGTALHYRALAMPAGRASLQMTLSSQGRSASALTGAISGSGTVTLEAARIGGLDPRAFEVAIRAGDAGQATDDLRLRKIVEPALSGGALLVTSAQIPFIVRDGRLRISATALEAEGVRAIVSGGYDIPADQADIRATLTAPGGAGQVSPPEIAIFATGTPDALDRSVDVAALSSWLAVRAIDRETKRLNSMEHGEATPASIAPQAQPLPSPPDAASAGQSSGPPSAEAPRPLLPRPKVSAPRPPATPPVANAPVVNAPVVNVPAANTPAPNAPVVSQQAQQQVLPPLPPPIEVRPPPGAARPARLRPPLVITPPVAQQPAF